MFSSIMMLMMDSDYVADHDKIRMAVKDIHSKGFDTVSIELRNSVCSMFDPEGHEAVKAAAKQAHELGMSAVAALPFPGVRLLGRHPEARQKWVLEHRCHVRNHQFQLELAAPAAPDFSGTIPVFCGIGRFYLAERNGLLLTDIENVTDNVSYTVDFELAPLLKGTCEKDGELLLYAVYQTDWPDYSCGRVYEAADEMLAALEDIPLEGIALDEFGTASRREDVYLGGESFLEDFSGKYGYSFMDHIYLLKNDMAGVNALRVRLDYYNLTIGHTYSLQKYMKEQFEKRRKKEAFTGFHHTWWGEGNSGDLWAGCIDYFRLAGTLTGGFTDSQYFSERTMLSMTLLAESLAKCSSSGTAYNMCWNFHPTSAQMDYYHRVLSVRNVRWIGHGYGRTNGFGPGYPLHFTWKDAKRATGREKAFQQFFGKGVSKPKVAVLYLWESVAGVNDRVMHYHRLGLKALLHKLLLRHIEADVVSGAECDLMNYEVLIVPWPVLMPDTLWSQVKAAAGAGRRILFLGPPARRTTSGSRIADEFGALVGVREPEETGGRVYSGEYEYEAGDLWFTDKKIDMQFFPLSVSDGTVLIEHGNEVLGVRRENVEYYSFELPLTSYFEPVLQQLEEYRSVNLPRGILSKTAQDGELSLLTLTGQWGNIMNVEFFFDGNGYVIRNGKLVGIKSRNGEIVELVSEAGAAIRVNGKAAEYTCIG